MMTDTDYLVRKGLPDILPKLRRFALVLALNQADADDLVQTAIERALTRAHQFRAEARLESWMFKIMQNIWIDQKRSQARKGIHIDVDAINNMVGEDGRKTTAINAMMVEVRKSIVALPDEQRLVVGLILVEGQSYKDAANIIGAPIGTIMSRLSRARQAIMNDIGLTSFPESQMT